MYLYVDLFKFIGLSGVYGYTKNKFSIINKNKQLRMIFSVAWKKVLNLNLTDKIYYAILFSNL